jgi:processive 1,2-diacylglycerol beta-glucosyltransferase
MKVLFVYASAGAGHLKAAEAVCRHCKRSHPDFSSETIDVLRYTNPLFRSGYGIYSFLVKYAPSLWRLGFLLTSLKSLRPAMRPLSSLINRLNTGAFRDLLLKEDPDYVVSTHFLSSEIAASLKAEHAIHAKVITVITDFGVHPFWINHGTDLYVVASGVTARTLIAEGIAKERIAELGIPVDDKFLSAFDREALCKKFDLDPQACTVLIVTGSFGIGPIEEICAALSGPVQVLAVCARNKRLFVRLKQKNYPQTRVFGFVDNIEELMSLSQIIITKPGGLSIAEALVKDLIPIFISPIPGQETENVRVLKDYGLGICTNDITAIKDEVLSLCSHPEKLASERKIIRELKKPDAAKDICDVLR